MRFSVECAFPHLGKRGGTSRKGALWARRLTEKRSLRARFTACFTKKRSLAPAARVCSMLATPYSPKA